MHGHVSTKLTRKTRRRRVSSSIQFNVSVDRLLGGDTHVYIYEGRRFLYSFQPEQGNLCALRCFLSYLFDLLKSAQHRDFPAPVGRDTKTSFPRMKLKIISRWLSVIENRNEASAEML